MQPTGNADEYQANIPASGDNIDISYYIAVVDQADQVTYDPPNPPDTLFTFHVGADTIKPVITHTPLEDQAQQDWPATVSATVTDNYGVDTVICYFSINQKTLDQSFGLSSTGNDLYSGAFPVNGQPNDSVFYVIKAFDISNNQNQSQSPATGEYSFRILRGKGLIEGYVDLTDNSDDSGVAIYLSGSLEDTTYSDASGYYSFAELDTGTYNVRPQMDGYNSTPESVNDIAVQQDTTSDVNFTLDPIISGLADGAGNAPTTYKLEQNYPNPFSGSRREAVTMIKYQLPKAGQVELAIFNIRGQKVRTLFSGFQNANYYVARWDGTNESGRKVSSGIYIYRIKAGDFVQVRRMLFTK